MYQSATSLFRDSLMPYCKGYGIDIGFGGDKICPSAIGIDLPIPYAETGTDPVQIGCDASQLPFKDESLDYVYSSHLLEDFENTVEVLKEWLRVIKPGGNLILLLPDELKYRTYCTSRGEGRNEHHTVIMNFDYLITCINCTGYKYELIYHSGIINEFHFAAAIKKASGLRE